jgi:hypothetical protein
MTPMAEKIQTMQRVEIVARTLFAMTYGDGSREAWSQCDDKPKFREAAKVAMADLRK